MVFGNWREKKAQRIFELMLSVEKAHYQYLIEEYDAVFYPIQYRAQAHIRVVLSDRLA